MSELPIQSLLPAIAQNLSQRDELVLEAPPGAGKTTLVPLALYREPWLGDNKILMLEPRRLAARAAAERMAALLDERAGETVGYRVRLESKISPRTRIEVVTEGVLGRLLQDDPSLEDYGLLIFDEFHERSLDADLGLALSLESRKLFADLRDAPLKLLLMSATLDGERIAGLLGGAPVLRSEGRQYPVDIHYCGSQKTGSPLPVRMATVIEQAWWQHQGSILAFLPGQGEIHRCEALLKEQLDDALIYPLYGSLKLEQQRLAVLPAPSGRRKIVLATSLAESSLTIEGVTVVVDGGQQRQSAFDPATSMSRLVTKPISKASATQRAGRAGRLQAGVCYRLWTETEQQGLAEYSEAEIVQADLASFALQLLDFGIEDVTQLTWLDTPPAAHYRQALAVLATLRALDPSGRLNAHGQAMAALPAHPRLAHMLISARQWPQHAPAAAALASDLAALLAERDILREQGSDMSLRLAALRGDYRLPRSQQGVLQRLRKQSQQFLRSMGIKQAAAMEDDQLAAEILAMAYPDRIAKQHKTGSREYQLANGRRAELNDGDALCNSPWLVVAELGGQQGRSRDRIYRAALLDPDCFESRLAELVDDQLFCDWDEQLGRFIAEQRRCIGALLWQSQPLDKVPEPQKTQALLNLFSRRGLGLLNWDDTARQLRGRVAMMRQLEGDVWPDWSDQGLIDSAERWLAPYLTRVSKLADFAKLNCTQLLRDSLDWQQQNNLDTQLPTSLRVPSGSNIRLDYTQQPPVLAVKLQEMFGCEQSPRLANGRIDVMIHLLSPARRPLQITQDLAGFWRGSYQQVKKEMKGRYPKHPWPDNPLEALPTARAKPRK